MSNNLSTRRRLQAFQMIHDGASTREVMRHVGIARETASRLKQCYQAALLDNGKPAMVCIGTNAQGQKVYYESRELRPQWAKEHGRCKDRLVAAILVQMMNDGIVRAVPGGDSEDPLFELTETAKQGSVSDCVPS